MIYNIFITDISYDWRKEMKLHALGIDYHHSSDFDISRPEGSGDNLLIVFKTKAQVKIEDEFVFVEPNTAIVYSKRYPQYYRAAGNEYINHWIHFDIEDEELFFEGIGLPFNTVVSVSDSVSIEKLMLQLNLEQVSDGVNKEECINLILKLILAKLSGDCDKSRHNSVHYDKLRALRAEIYRNPAKCRSISEFASILSLSPSHFQALYKKEFGVSCYEDVLIARLDLAKYYLKNTYLPINRIAELCGYENDVHFIRQFKSRFDITAGEYRKKHKH